MLKCVVKIKATYIYNYAKVIAMFGITIYDKCNK